ncbi:GNAT family N-acetyltransferase [Aureimonas sp. AU40]|uniref:GNAT family N-acetyltransferase n=1 Tax=Aureimonas sp. AU40 TaxID=1637747 RepID=UPI000781776D|nr:GNAT family N-acetyltransferase [Aureimonas sp. AU40]
MKPGEWRWRRFDALHLRELHDLLKLRCDVFVVEQACAFAEIDGRDPDALHLLRLEEGGALAGCLRLFAPDESKGDEAERNAARIGRIATAPAHRGTGLGHLMMAEALRLCAERWPEADILLSAQSHLQSFYGKHGFQPVSEPYLEDDIPHIDMRRRAGAAAALS